MAIFFACNTELIFDWLFSHPHNHPPLLINNLAFMKKVFSSLLFILILNGIIRAAAGDTTWVQVFTFGSVQDTVAVFPDASKRFEKILMYYTLKCNPNQTPACGEWDYLTYTHLYRLSDNERFEIGRYITPYGNGLDLGRGFLWLFDVSDYRTLLTDSIRITAGNWQELLDLKFAFIEGIPTRDIIAIDKLWVGQPGYGTSTPIENFLIPKVFSFQPDAKNARLKLRVSGHGFGGNENCAEFCPKNHSFRIDGVTRFQKLVWRSDCDLNPVYPQGGTWVYDRTNWCPGAIVETYDFELSPFMVPGGVHQIEYNIDAYTWNGQGSTPYYDIESQIVSYGLPNFQLDAAIEDIIAPTTMQIHGRKNPICANPVIKIKNNCTTDIYTLVIRYGIENGDACYFRFNDTLKFLETAEVTLPLFNWNSIDTLSPVFFAEVIEPNNVAFDEYSFNNRMTTPFEIPPLYETRFAIFFKTNLYPEENAYYIKDASDSIILSRTGMAANLIYRDTLNLLPGCYKFIVTDSGAEGEDGLSWWANNDGTGYARFKKLNGAVGFWKTFEPDFGSLIYHEFMVGYPLGQQPDPPYCEDISAAPSLQLFNRLTVFPNPTQHIFNVELFLNKTDNLTLTVYNITGNPVFTKQFLYTDAFSETINMQGFPPGMYFVVVKTGSAAFSCKIFITH
jgi:hypothetical protein